MLVRVACSPTHHWGTGRQFYCLPGTAYWWFSQIPKKYQNTFKHFSSCSVLCVQALSLLTSSNFFWPLFVAACLIGGRTEPAPPQKQPQIRALPVRPGFPPPGALAGPGLVLLLSSVAGLCVQALSSSWPFPSHLLKRWPGEGGFGTKKAISGHLL